ncbi:probable dolichyl pyrophosphate Glc1Man9GlcNAc2 alpha-1,3-glucosyltransferase isoform X3 [Photinus pyralis]|uniref:Alpha-1,3-glucosyltransferase n=1 Tax=Photinus pyralis TaxID=7054 RepID=A0A1Y1LZ74_PHOPY|nr:probable dolichyl pyrophosphate Glc1Man9GlcNAc2 alpha-1,3-glucosyltransferase isoform X3 [Photinus pyralis]
MICVSFLLLSCVKLLLIPAYRSTDFEVHRNWLAITSNLPIDKWYYEDTSQWTLDYPPLFAWFEYFLSRIGYWFDPQMLVLNNHNYASFKTILFQRLSVILTDAIFAYGSYRCSQIFRKSWKSQAVLPLLLLTNVGLLLVDHIHFQYNGIMFGFLLLSCANLFQANYLSGAFWFLVLLNFKHIYLYIAPAYFIYLLRNYCITSRNLSIKNVITGFSVRNTIYLGSTVILVFAVTFVPFVGHINQVMSRLFPFKRGLCHAYWAPNFWAIYNVADKVLFMLGSNIMIQRRRHPTLGKGKLTIL